MAAFEKALEYNPRSAEVARKIKRLGQLQKEKQIAQELENLKSNVNVAKHLESFKSELVSFCLLQVKNTLNQYKLPCVCLIISGSETDRLHMNKHLQSANYGAEESWKEMFSFLVETMETAVKSWHETSKVDNRVYFLLDKDKTQTDKYAPVVNIDKVLKKVMSQLIDLTSFFYLSAKTTCSNYRLLSHRTHTVTALHI